MKRILLALAVVCFAATAYAQQPQTQAVQELFPVNAKYVQGFGPGYWPTAGSNLTLNLAPGTAVCSNVVRTYAGGTYEVIWSLFLQHLGASLVNRHPGRARARRCRRLWTSCLARPVRQGLRPRRREHRAT